jgi:hypothetical protein
MSATAATGRLAPPLAQAVPAWLRSAGDWLRAGDSPQDRAAADRLAADPPRAATPRAVIIGETNRGKSSLVNALLGTPGLSPVDAGVATSTYLLFRHGEQPGAVVRFGGGFADITIPPEQLADWATL